MKEEFEHRPQIIRLMWFLAMIVFFFEAAAFALTIKYKSDDWNATQLCEEVHLDLYFYQPINAWSSISFLLTAFLIALEMRTWLDFAFVVVLINIGFAAASFHGSLLEQAYTWDLSAVFIGVSFLCAATMVDHWLQLSCIWVMLVLVSVIVPIFLSEEYASDLPVYLLGSFYFIVLTALSIFRGINYTTNSFEGLFNLGVAALCFSTGICFYVGAKTYSSAWCDPSSFFQPHAVWHILCAVGFYFDWKFLKETVAIF